MQKAKHSKVLHIVHRSLNLQEYLKPNNIQNIQLSKFLFLARTRMVECRTNFSNQYKTDDLKCPLKCSDQDTQEHIIHCDKIDINCLAEELPKHSDLFANDVENQLKVAAILQDRLQRRKKLLKELKTTSI